MVKRKITYFYIIMLVAFGMLIKAQSGLDQKIDSLKKVLTAKKADRDKLLILRDIVYEYSINSEFDSSIKFAQIGLNMATKKNDSLYIQKFYNRIGVAYWNLSDYKKALEVYNRGILYCNPKREEEIGSYYNNIGLVHWDQGDLAEALKLFLKSNEIDKRIGNKENMASSVLNMGLIYDDLNDKKNALKCYYEALQYAQEINDLITIGICYNNIGKTYNSEKNRNKALDFYHKAIIISLKAGDRRNAAMASNNIGAQYSDEGILDSATKYLSWAHETFKKIGDVSGSSLVVNNLEGLYIKKKDYKKAEKILREAENVNTSTNNYEELATTYKSLIEVLEINNKYKEAYEYRVLLTSIKDTLAENYNALIINDVTKEYELKGKEKVAALNRLADRKVAEAEKKKQNYFTVAIVAILVLSGIFSFFLYNRFKLSRRQNKIISSQKHLVEEKQKEILDSIHYAKRIQTTIIANQPFIDKNIQENFVLFNPKDIVSGDFYWATKRDHLFYLAICDSTGHGVPGAFMSVLNIGFLVEAINEKGILEPHRVFDYVRDRLENTISKEGQKDGFDGILLCYDTITKQMTYSAANNEPILIRDNQIIELPKDKMPVGIGERKEPFKLYTIESNKGDIIYFYTDGYADQFGGPKGKKFKYKPLNELLLSMNQASMDEQKNTLQVTFDKWKGTLEQVDDVCIIGIKI